MTFLPDVNVWIALAVGEHEHSLAAREWLDNIDDRVLFCRVTQMSLLRLLTNRQVLGRDTFSPSQAWNAFDKFMGDGRISKIEEPPGLDQRWRAFTIVKQDGSSWWTDSYLEAFATAAGLTLVTFDAKLAARKNVSARLLK
jgi:toxin-antitoxin system PIN domain toxin